MIKEIDTVVLSRDGPEHGLKREDIGAVVHCYKNGKGFEFITGKGETVAVITLIKRTYVRCKPRRFCTFVN